MNGLWIFVVNSSLQCRNFLHDLRAERSCFATRIYTFAKALLVAFRALVPALKAYPTFLQNPRWARSSKGGSDLNYNTLKSLLPKSIGFLSAVLSQGPCTHSWFSIHYALSYHHSSHSIRRIRAVSSAVRRSSGCANAFRAESSFGYLGFQ